jgi:hypothetical protein
MTESAIRTGVAAFSVVALDCPEPLQLVEFYSRLTGWPVADGSEASWAELKSPSGPTIAFQRVDGAYRPPEWPGQEHPQQFHLDFDVADLDDGERDVLALGATKADFQPGKYFRVFLDPAGHPFCLVKA